MQRIAVIGTGMVAKAHLLSIADLGAKIELAGVLSRTRENAEAFAKLATDACGYPVSVYDDLDALCADRSVDWVILLTPPNARVEIVEALCRSGKSILLEKPIERDLKAARHIVEMCSAADVSLGLVFQHRVRKASRQLAELIDGGIFGALSIAEVFVPWWREQAYYNELGRGTYARDGGGVLISQAIHSLDLMLSFTGAVSEVQAMASTTDLHDMESEDYVSAALKFENGAVGSLIASTASYPGDAESITLHFTNCVARLQSGKLQLKWRDGREDLLGEIAGTGGGADPMAFTHDWHRGVIEDFADAFAARVEPEINGQVGLEVHALIEALIQSSNEKRAVSVPKSDI